MNFPRSDGGLDGDGDAGDCAADFGGGAGFGTGGGDGCARNFDLNPVRARSARRPRARRFFTLRFLAGFMKRESTRRTVGMNVGTSSGGSSNPSLSFAVAPVSTCSGDGAASRCRKRDTATEIAAMSGSQPNSPSAAASPC
ncbi:hypothetical protein GGR43_001024 [Sphingobium jiangsuense]|uniref:Uncharacterized protein n=1 Tax=Sphingobium jiangsuense TaxID=870476 RepID=A0A7W6BHV9_9SPHN|nr:hypothetical protein [Sphingobium jiangsuense]